MGAGEGEGWFPRGVGNILYRDRMTCNISREFLYGGRDGVGGWGCFTCYILHCL